ncbi:MAG: 5-formyltetrahydrofolate cyclo-ligase [Pyrinomonadaceae bacterium]|nr:5-formyltetrahydrofolate cyclo-ligase [Pyrinomonadaceae bacterium]
MTKSELRRTFLIKQKSLSVQERQKLSQQIADQFFANFAVESFKNLHLFLSIEKNGEVDTKFIYEKLRQDFPHLKTYVPRVGNEVLEHLEFTTKTEVIVSRWGIDEPVGNDLADEKLFDAVIVPLLCFDKRGYRVGYGKGFYDKFLAKCRTDCLKIGVSYFPPIESIEINEFDVKLDYCLTPNSVF